MFSTWMKLSLDAARLGYEMQTVMALRMLKLAQGGAAATTEAQRMVTEKGVAFAEAAATLATGGSMDKVVRRVRSRVSQTSAASCLKSQRSDIASLHFIPPPAGGGSTTT